MSTGYQIDDQNAMYFVTPTIVDWVDIFTRKIYREIITDSLNYCIKEKGLLVYGYVIMTNHLHLIIRSECGKLSGTIRDFKKFTAAKIIETIQSKPESRREWMLHRFEWNASTNMRSSNNQVWTHENHAEQIFSLKFFNQKLNYLHENPVRAGWVTLPEDYIYSSASTLIKNAPGLLPISNWEL
ncbi:MAG: transposase [Taibaiella sp.]|nr:transposase [Taibaiella sp.]